MRLISDGLVAGDYEEGERPANKTTCKLWNPDLFYLELFEMTNKIITSQFVIWLKIVWIKFEAPCNGQKGASKFKVLIIFIFARYARYAFS
ncbi:MAG: hypothetical protein A3D21_08890 [Nitrospirae bacterium RIFCSPHIGHO2_02_FULL_42_12]|nr:MAG: hypothetical protein A3D21_08890 [Nitrospirae bacterium RIFCSPHIGHO2_02_FULL_42_12]